MERESVRYPQLVVRMSLSVPPGLSPTVWHNHVGAEIRYAWLNKSQNGKTGNAARVS